MQVPFFRPAMGAEEIEEVVRCLKSGWLTTGPVTKRFELEFAAAVGAKHAVALNSCTAALHLAVEALGLRPGQAVLVPTMTFAATAEIVRYQGAIPVLVDCDADHLHLDLEDAERKLEALRAGRLDSRIPAGTEVVGIIPVHVGGLMLEMQAVANFARKHRLWLVEDSAHALPAAWRPNAAAPWQRSGEGTADVTCFSFYANKTMTTGEGGMATTNDAALADRMRSMSLHGLSHDAWKRYSGGAWDYRIIAPGYKYNLTDIASAIGVHQLARAEAMRQTREALAGGYRRAFEDLDELEPTPEVPNRVHSHHLFAIRLNLAKLTASRDVILQTLKDRGVGCSMHWRPLHKHPYYEQEFGWTEAQLPIASREWQRRISLPLFPAMQADEFDYVVRTVRSTLAEFRAPQVCVGAEIGAAEAV